LAIDGDFTTVNGTARKSLAQLNSDGSLDTSFTPPAFNDYLLSIAQQANGQLLISGAFTMVDGVDARSLVRLNLNGTRDTGFSLAPYFQGGILALFMQPDGKFVAAGPTALSPPSNRESIARFNMDGSRDATFELEAYGSAPDDHSGSSSIRTLTPQADNTLIAAGEFTAIGGSAQICIAKINADGTVDNRFNPNANSEVDSLAIMPDGKIILAGSFDEVSGTARPQHARLSQPEAALQSLQFSGSTVTWMRSGSSPELSLPPQLLFSLDGNTFTPLGAMSRIAGGWSYNYATLPPIGQPFYLRTNGEVVSGQFNTSHGVVESTRQLFVADKIFAGGFEVAH
jgi:uncharacterized delta-60 repeat protein